MGVALIAHRLFERPLILSLVILILIATGYFSFEQLPQREDPELTRRVAVLACTFPGAAPLRIEAEVTRVLESALSGVSGVDSIRSSSRESVVQIAIELDEDIQDVDAVWSRVRQRLDQAESTLPSQCDVEPLRVIPLQAFSAIIAVRSADSEIEAASQPGFGASEVAAVEALQTELTGVAGTHRVEVIGLTDLEYVVDLAPEALLQHGLSLGAIAGQLDDQLRQPPLGSVATSSGQLGASLAFSADSDQPIGRDRIRSVLLRGTGPGSASIRLGEIADIVKQPTAPPDDAARIDGASAVVLGIMMDSHSDGVTWSDQVQDRIERFNDTTPTGLSAQLIFSQREHVRSRLVSLAGSLLFGMAAVTLVVGLMMGLRCMVVVAISLPLSVAMVLTGMHWMEVPIHQISVTGLIVALGLLIDNAIIVVDDIASRRREGVAVAGAVTASVRQLRLPLLGATVTTSLAFWPIAMLPGPPGEFVGTIAVSVILAVTASFVLSITVIPALTGWLRISDQDSHWWQTGIRSRALTTAYRWLLGGLFRMPIVSLSISLIVPIVGLACATKLPLQFFPPSDRSQIQIELEHASSTPLRETADTVATVEQILSSRSEVRRQSWFLGRNAPAFYYNLLPRREFVPSYAQGVIDLAPGASTEATAQRLQSLLESRVPQARVAVRQFEQGPPFEAPIEIRLIGSDLSALRSVGIEVERLLRSDPLIVATQSDLGEAVSRLSFSIDRDAMLDRDVTESMIADTLYARLNGLPAGEVFERDGGNERRVPVRVRLEADDPETRLDAALAMPLGTAGRPGAMTPQGTGMPPAATMPTRPQPTRPQPTAGAFEPPLGDLVGVGLSASLGSIVRLDGQRTNIVRAYLKAGVLPSQAIQRFQNAADQQGFSPPAGIQLEYGGEKKERGEAVYALLGNGVFVCLMMAVTLILTTGSLGRALIISGVGAAAAATAPFSLWCFGMPYGFMAILGTMGMVGVAINDSIVVLSLMPETELASCKSHVYCVNRVVHSTRHILSTSMTTLVGFLPLILGGGDFWPPLAITMAFGVALATLLALVFVPCCLLLFRSKQWRSAVGD